MFFCSLWGFVVDEKRVGVSIGWGVGKIFFAGRKFLPIGVEY